MLPSWMIKLTEGWGKPKKDSDGEDNGFKREKKFFSLSLSSTSLTRPSSTIIIASPNFLLAAHIKWRSSNERLNKRVFLHPKVPALQAKIGLIYTIFNLKANNALLPISPRAVQKFNTFSSLPSKHMHLFSNFLCSVQWVT